MVHKAKGGAPASAYWRKVKQQPDRPNGRAAADDGWREAAPWRAQARSWRNAGSERPREARSWRDAAIAPRGASASIRSVAASAVADSGTPGTPQGAGSPSRGPLLRPPLVSGVRASWADLSDADTSIGSDTEDSNELEAPPLQVGPDLIEKVEQASLQEVTRDDGDQAESLAHDGAENFNLREDAEEFQPSPLHQAFLQAQAAAEEHQRIVNQEKCLGTWTPFWCSAEALSILGPWDADQMEIEEHFLAFMQGKRGKA